MGGSSVENGGLTGTRTDGRGYPRAVLLFRRLRSLCTRFYGARSPSFLGLIAHSMSRDLTLSHPVPNNLIILLASIYIERDGVDSGVF